MSTNSPKWSVRFGRAASGAVDMRRARGVAALFACAWLASCGSGGGTPDVGSGTPTPPGPIAWGAEQTLATDVPALTGPAAAFGDDGRAVVIWAQTGIGTPNDVPFVGVRESTTGVAFAALEVIEPSLAQFAPDDTIADLAAAPSAGGGTLAAWSRTVPDLSAVRLGAALRQPANWTFDEIATSGDAAELAVATNEIGDRVAVWTESLSGVRTVRVAWRRVSDAGWQGPENVSDAVIHSESPAVAIDENRVAMIVWRQGSAPGQIRARSLQVASGMPGIDQPVDPQVNDQRNPKVVPLNTGQFVATWEQAGAGGFWDLRANRGTMADWENGSVLLELGAGTVDASNLVAGPNATAYAVWRQNNAVFFSRLSGGLWSDARQLGATLAGTASGPQVAVADDGNAVFTWVQSSVTNDLMYALFTPGNGTLSAAFPLESQAGDVLAHALAVASNGAAVVSWSQAVAGQPNPNLLARVFRP